MFGNQHQRAVGYGIVDANAAFQIRALSVAIDPFSQIVIDAGSSVDVRKQRPAQRQRPGDHPAMIGRVKTARHHAQRCPPRKRFELGDHAVESRLGSGQFDKCADQLQREGSIRAGFVVGIAQIDQAGWTLHPQQIIGGQFHAFE